MATTYIDMTPTWSGMLPALLDARSNIKRRLFAEECDGKADGWCSVHEAEWERDTDTVCRYDEAKWAGVRQGLFTELTNLDGEFAKMAKGADMAVAIQTLAKGWRKDGVPEHSVLLNQVLDAIGWAD